MDILSLTHNVRVGQEVEPRGIKPPERNFGKEVRKTGSPPTRGAPSDIRADRKEASQIEPKPLQQALDLLEAVLPFDPNFRDLALNKKIRPGFGLGNVLLELDLHVENGKPKFKDLLAAIGVDVPATLSTRNLTVLQQAIVEKIDAVPVPASVKRLIDAFLRTDNRPVTQAFEIGRIAPDARILDVDNGGRTGIIRSQELPTPVVSFNPMLRPLLAAPPQPMPGIQVKAGDNGIREGAVFPPAFGMHMPTKPSGIPERFFIEAPRPGVPQDLLGVPIKIAPELGAHKIEVQAVLPPVNLETMVSILSKGLSPTALRESITAQAPVPTLNAGSLTESKPTLQAPIRPVRGAGRYNVVASHSARPTLNAEDGKPVTQHSARPKSSNAVPTTVSHPTPEANATGTLITPDSLVGRRPRLNNGPVPLVSNHVPSASSAQPLTAARPTLIGYRSGVAKGTLPDFEAAAIHASDPGVPLASNVSEGARRTIDASALRLAAQQIVSSVHDSIIDHIQEIAASQGRGRVVIRLQPEDLGSITVSVRSFGQRVEADIRASNDAVRDALVAHRGDLVQSVESKGLSLDSFNVGQEADGEPQTSDQRADRNHDMRQEFERFANVSQASRQDVPVVVAAHTPWFAPTTEVVDYTV
ncbi:MAG: flagellar hook-length control protein FliK [Armatimonadetes bacterium]|nr:flagellar hook-length control protein FliK [Armatimonadota bacterium]